jgi:hypothetical protein
MYSDNDAAAAGVSFSLSGRWSRRDMASGDVADEPSAFAGDGGGHDANWRPRLRNTAVTLKTSSLWFPVRLALGLMPSGKPAPPGALSDSTPSIGSSNVKPADALERKDSMMTVMQWQLTAGKELT